MFEVKVINCVPAYSNKHSQTACPCIGLQCNKTQVSNTYIRGSNHFSEKNIIFFCLSWNAGNSQIWMVWEELCISQSSSPHLWITSRNYMKASKTNRHNLLKLILFLLVKLLSPYPLYCCHPSILPWRMRQRCSLDSHKPQHTSSTSPANIRTFCKTN